MRNKKILIAGGSYSDIPLIKAAKEKGLYVITTGNRKDDLGHQFSDEFELADFSNKEDILELAQKLNIDFICPSCHDLSLVSCAYVAGKLNLPGYDSYKTTLTLHHKDLFKDFSFKNRLLTPKAYTLNSKEDNIPKEFLEYLPLIVKPIDLGGGKGITKVTKECDLKQAIDSAFHASKSKRIVIEEFVEGTLHSFSTIIKDKRVIFSYADNEYSFNNPYGVSTSTSPAINFKEVKDKLLAQTEKVAKLLDLKDGLLHMQYLMHNNKINVIEFTRRMPGDWYAEIVNYSTGLDYANIILESFLYNKLDNMDNYEQKGFYSRHCVMSTKKGEIKQLIIDPVIKDNIINQYLWFENKKVINPIYDKFGLVFLKYFSENEMLSKSSNINNLIRMDVE